MAIEWLHLTTEQKTRRNNYTPPLVQLMTFPQPWSDYYAVVRQHFDVINIPPTNVTAFFSLPSLTQKG